MHREMFQVLLCCSNFVILYRVCPEKKKKKLKKHPPIHFLSLYPGSGGRSNGLSRDAQTSPPPSPVLARISQLHIQFPKTFSPNC